MNNFLSRLILTLVSVPLLMFFIFWPERNHIAIIIIFGFIVTFLGSYELASLINKKGIKLKSFLIPTVNISAFLFAYFYANDLFGFQKLRGSWLILGTVFIAAFSFFNASDIFKKSLKLSFEKMSYAVFSIIYIGVPSFLLPFIFNISFSPVNPSPVFYNIESHGTLTGSLLVLFMIVNIFGNDIFCYVFGMAFGRSNVIGLEASPKKSWAGYIGGFVSTLVLALIYFMIFEKALKLISMPLWFYIFIPAVAGFLVPIGDLVESVIKRSSQVKDSGSLILGRGGVLDSVDSILYFTPIYFFILQFYFAFGL
jgi:phosphatidate cytidylyltransferase